MQLAWRPCLDSSERKNWIKYCFARRWIPPTRVTKSQRQGRIGINVNIWNRAKKSQVLVIFRRNQVYLDIFRYISVYKACISSFIPLIKWSFRMITHCLSGGGKGMKGYNALDCTMIPRGSAGARLRRYNELCFLPDKPARFFFEFHADDYISLRLPAIPSFASSGDIHKR